MALLPRLHPFMTNIRQVSLSSCFLKTAPSQGELPKRPTTPWTSYYTANYPGVKERYPNLPTPEIMRLISGNWKKLPDTEKDRLQKIYHDEKRQYLAKLDQVPSSLYLGNLQILSILQLPEGTLQRAKEMKREKKEIKKEKKDKKEAELVKKLEKKERSEAASELRKLEENKPKRNLNSYLLYANDRR